MDNAPDYVGLVLIRSMALLSRRITKRSLERFFLENVLLDPGFCDLRAPIYVDLNSLFQIFFVTKLKKSLNFLRSWSKKPLKLNNSGTEAQFSNACGN